MTKFINLTPHEVVVYTKDSDQILFSVPPSGTFLRADEEKVDIGKINGVPILRLRFGKVDNLPEHIPDTVYIVSQITAQAIKELYPSRYDFIITAEAVRDGAGKIIGCRAFAKV